MNKVEVTKLKDFINILLCDYLKDENDREKVRIGLINFAETFTKTCLPIADSYWQGDDKNTINKKIGWNKCRIMALFDCFDLKDRLLKITK